MSTFIAKSNIPWGEGGVLAYTRGQTVKADAVKDNGWQEFVVADGTKEAAEIKSEITGRPVSDFETSAPAARRTASTSNQEG